MLQSLPSDPPNHHELPSSYLGLPFTLPTDSSLIIALTNGGKTQPQSFYNSCDQRAIWTKEQFEVPAPLG